MFDQVIHRSQLFTGKIKIVLLKVFFLVLEIRKVGYFLFLSYMGISGHARLALLFMQSNEYIQFVNL